MAYNVFKGVVAVKIIETNTYSKSAKKLVSDEEKKLICDLLAFDPERGAIIKGSGGARKTRFAVKGKGKSGGVRIIYYYINKDYTIILLDIFSKSDKDNITQKEINEIRKFLNNL